MNYLIQHGKVRQQAIGVPEGLPELLSDITREVLRCQPTKECLCQFIIDYLHSLIVTREKAMVARTILDRALRQVDSIISDMCVCDLTKEKSDMMAKVMEDCFRNFLEKRRCEMRRGKEAVKLADIDMLEELIQKCSFSEDELNRSRPTIESAYKRFVDAYMAAAKDTQGTEILYQYFRDRELKRIEDILREASAVKIQSAWRGYMVRRTMEEQLCLCTCLTDEETVDVKKHDGAARVIQRFFRNVLLRQVIKPFQDPCVDLETPTSKYGRSEEVVTFAGPESAEISQADTLVVAETVELEPIVEDELVVQAVEPPDAAIPAAEVPEEPATTTAAADEAIEAPAAEEPAAQEPAEADAGTAAEQPEAAEEPPQQAQAEEEAAPPPPNEEPQEHAADQTAAAEE